MTTKSPTDRTYTAGHFALDLGGGFAGYIKSVDGGNLKAPVMTEPGATDNIIYKHIGQPEFDDITFQIGLSQSPAVNKWIADSWAKRYVRKTGRIVSCDFNFKPRSARNFYEALITEVGFPALDAAAKEPGYLTVKLKPELVKMDTDPGKKVNSIFTQYQKGWLPANFRLDVDGLDCKRVSKIDAFTIKQSVTRNETGELRDATIEPTKLEYPNLTIYMAESHAKSWLKWCEDFIYKGNNGKDNEKQGHLHFLAPNMKDELGEIELVDMGPFSVGFEKSEAGQEQIKRVKIELYVQEMKFKPKGNFSTMIGR